MLTDDKPDYLQALSNELEPPGTFPACYAFSMHKAGSSLMGAMIKTVCKRASIPALSIADTLFKVGTFEKDWEADRRILDLLVPGRVYYGFRHLPKLLCDEPAVLKGRKTVMLVRDPRDALVSMYFSFGGRFFSHKLPEKNSDVFLDRAKATAHLSIDEYVLGQSHSYFEKLRAYREHLDSEELLLRRYEEIYYDKRRFLGDIYDHFGIQVDPRLLDQVAARHDVRPEVEDPSKHIRKGTPGDHMEKLKPETISQLNDVFGDLCKWFGYELGA